MGTVGQMNGLRASGWITMLQSQDWGIRGDVVGILAWCGRDSGVVGLSAERGLAER